MMDRTIKRAILIPFIVVIAAKTASTVYDQWMGETQSDMIANQEALAANTRQHVKMQNDAHVQTLVAEACEGVMRTPMCTRAKGMGEAADCILAMANASCAMLPSVHLCGAVEQLKECADPFADAKANGCALLRRHADCERNPAPDDLRGLWRVKLDDGLWDGSI